jgi:hypothetical protein
MRRTDAYGVGQDGASDLYDRTEPAARPHGAVLSRYGRGRTIAVTVTERVALVESSVK